MSTRLEALRGMLQQDPNNAFVRYGVAMELVNSGDLEGAAAEFAKLREVNPNYAAAYYHGGQTLEKLGRTDEAIAVYRAGVAVTTASGDGHARSEMEAALSMLVG